VGRRLAPGALIADATQGYPGSDDYQGEPDDERARASLAEEEHACIHWCRPSSLSPRPRAASTSSKCRRRGLGPNFSAKASKKSFHCQRPLLYGATNTDPHATELRQNAAAKATWTERIGTKTPGKAGSVSKETQPRAPEIDTMAPRSRGPPPKDAARPINIKPANSSTHQSVVAIPLNPNAPAIPSTAPKQPNTNPTTPGELAKFVCVAGGSRVRRPSSPPRNKAGMATLSTDTRAPVYTEMPGLSK
jgi:hypothetical protein